MSTTEATPLYVTVPCQFCGTRNKVNMARVAHRPKCHNTDCQRPILLDRPVSLKDDTFEEVIANADVPVLVDFYADWCGPCKAMAPVIDDVAGQYAGKVLVVKVNTDLAPQTAQAYNIRSIPTLSIFSGGRVTTSQMGAVPKAQLLQMLQANGVR
jgi:thioredoxin